MKNVVYILWFILKCLLFIVFLPFIALWLLAVYMRYRFVLIRNLVKAGMPREMARLIAADTGPGNLIGFVKTGMKAHAEAKAG